MNKLEKLKNALAQEVFGRQRAEGQCVSCGSDKMKPEDFKDELSLKESRITKFCQFCQDNFFDKDYEFDPFED